jgi:hypothetical protein
MKTLILIYTRTSSLSSYRKLSPDRQIQNLLNSFPYLNLETLTLISEQCKANLDLYKREGFSKIINLSKDHNIELYTESLSRIGRSHLIYEEFMKLENITPHFSIGLNTVLTDRTEAGGNLRVFMGRQ